jgi:hypothetical protein
MSCKTEINPKWKHAIDSNVCPFCGEVIMDLILRDLLSNLRKNIDNFPPEFLPHLDDWLFSNYNYVKADSKMLVKNKPEKEKPNNKYTVKVDTENGPQEIQAEKIQSEDKTNEFFKRAEAVRPNIDGFNSTAEKTAHLKQMVQKIKKGGTASSDQQIMDAELMAQMASDLENSEDKLIQSSLPSSDDEDEVPSVVLNMASQYNKNASQQNGGVNMKDLMALQKMHDRVNNSKQNFESGENRGKGGFSRV